MITYSSLIPACKKAGEWKLALQVGVQVWGGRERVGGSRGPLCVAQGSGWGPCKSCCCVMNGGAPTCPSPPRPPPQPQTPAPAQLFDEMQQEGCVPNVISYNSLITACAQGESGARFVQTCCVAELSSTPA